MKKLLNLMAVLIIYGQSVAQDHEPTPEQIEANKRYEKAKMGFLEGQYENVINYYDSLPGEHNYPKLESYKMAYKSCQELSGSEGKDSILLINKSKKIYNDAVKWYGKMHVEERWDSLKIEMGKEPEVFKVVDRPPQFPGGLAAFYKYISQELKYPEEARRNGIEGKVYIQFVVNKDGSIDAVNAVKGIGGGCDKEAVRVIQNAPNFIPGMQEGKPVYVRMILPLTFKLSEKQKKKKRNRR